MATHQLHSGNGRWGNHRRAKREAQANGTYRQAGRALVVDCDRRTEEERRAEWADRARVLKVSARCFI